MNPTFDGPLSPPGLARALAVPPEKLRARVDPHELGFHTTDELEPTSEPVGQDRAMRAIRFGASIAEPDFNLFVVGPPGLGKTTAVKGYLEAKAASEPTPMDWVYVHNFETNYKPRALPMPQGRAQRLRDAMVRTIDELRAGLPALFDSEDYQNRRRAIEEQFRQAQASAFEEVNKKAEAESLTIFRTPQGFAVAPTQNGEVIKPDVYKELPEPTRKSIEAKIEALQKELGETLEKLPRWEREKRDKLRNVNEELAEVMVSHALQDTRSEFADVSGAKAFLDAVEEDLIQNVGLFLRPETPQGENEMVTPPPVETLRDPRFRRYMVNVIVSNGAEHVGAPIVEETNPALGNLVGRLEYLPQLGTLVTDFLFIKAGALHRANGGYLLLDARKVLLQPFAWEALKRAIRAEHVKIEHPYESIGLASVVTLDPDPIPLKVKVVLFGDRQLYYLLSALDPEFGRLFKVEADFDETVSRRADSIRANARLLGSIAKRHKLKPVDAGGMARLIEQASRIAGDQEKLSIEVGVLSDILREADFWAGEGKAGMIRAADVERAIDERRYRADRIRERSQEYIERNIVLVDTSGAKVGQINGLSVLQLGNFAFGRPSRITARVRLGQGRVTDIEREVKLGGPLHSKGVMILWGYLAGRFAERAPLALAASLVFEQSYGGVDGDSASSAELYALLSALAEVPVKQSLAVTGSVNQMGEVQAIGGVNEKIEGFFDICKERGLTGEQGVLIPHANVVNLMLKEEVVDAVAKGRFTIYAVKTINEGLELLTGLPAGERGADGLFAPGTVNRKVEDRLLNFANVRKEFGPAAANRVEQGDERNA